MHAATDGSRGVQPLTQCVLPSEDPFIGALSAGIVELMEQDNAVAPDRVKDALCAAFRSEVAARGGRVSDEELANRDAIALSLLAGRQHYFGLAGARGRTPALRKRDAPQASVETFLRNIASTHGHLLPGK